MNLPKFAVGHKTVVLVAVGLLVAVGGPVVFIHKALQLVLGVV